MKISVISIIFTDDKEHVVALKRCDVPVWVFPGGGVEDNESPEEAAIREAYEETGLTVRIVRKIGEYMPINKLTKLTYVFECSIISGKLQTGNETCDIDYFPIHQLPYPFLHVHHYWFNDALKNLKDVIKSQVSGTTYLHFFWFIFKHPILMFRYILTWTPFRINSKPKKIK